MSEQFDTLTAAALKAAWDKLPKMPMPDAYLMNWSTWCKMRRLLKQHGIPVEYRQVAPHRWTRYVNGVEVMMDRFITTEDIYEVTKPIMTLGLRLPVPTLRKMT